MRVWTTAYFFSSFKFNRRKDYYQILGVGKQATRTDIKRAYIKMAKKHHPDLNKDKESETFKEVNEANQVLSDTSTRN